MVQCLSGAPGARFRACAAFLAAAAFAALSGSPAGATSVFVNNGLAPPNPANVVSPGETTSGDDVWSRNVGCGSFLDPTAACPAPGAATLVEVVDSPISYGFAWDSSMLRISGTSTSNGVFVRDSGFLQLDGGDVTEIDLGDAGSSVMTGGSVLSVSLNTTGSFDMNGGTVAGVSGGAARLTIDGGHITGNANLANISAFEMISGRSDSFLFLGNSSGSVSGGDLDGQVWFGASSGLITGGTLSESGVLVASDASIVDWRGGLTEDSVGTGISTDLELRTAAFIRIFGTDFTVDGAPVGAGTVLTGTGSQTVATVEGTLESGETFSALVRNFGDGTLVLIPEPGSGALVAVGLLGIAARARRRVR